MDSNFQVKISADLSQLEASLKNVQALMGKVGNNADATGKVIKESSEKATVAVSSLNRTFQETNDKSGRARLAAFAFGQVIRDAGFFSQSFGLGLLAISNNIPILIDQLVLLTGVSAGVGTALSLVGSILTAALTVWAYSSSAVNKNKQSMEDWRASLNDATEAQLKGKQAALDEVTTLDILYRAATNVTNSTKTRIQAAKQLQEQYPTTLGNLSQEAIMAGKAAGAYNTLRDSIIDAAMAEAAKDKIVENATRILDNKTKVLEAQANILKLNTQLLKEEAAANKAAANANKYASSVTGGGAAVIDPFIKVRQIQGEIANQQKVINNAITDTNILNGRNVTLTGEIGKNTDAFVSRMADGSAKTGLSGIQEILKKLNDTITSLNLDPTLTELDRVKGKIDAYQSALKSLVEAGYKPNSDAVKNVVAELQKLNTTYDSLISKQEDLKKQTQFLNEIDKVAKSLESKRIDIFSGADLSKSKQIKQEIEAVSDALNKFQTLAKENPALAQFSGLNTVIGALSVSLADLKNKFNIATETENAAKQMEDFNTRLTDILANGAVQAISSTMQGVGEALASGGNVAAAAGSALLSTLGSVLSQLGELAISTGLAIEAIKTSLESLNPGVAIAAGIALLLLAGFVKGKAKSIGGAMGGGGGGGEKKQGDFGGLHTFASGGIISGPTNALMGEYPGAKTNPEVVAPLDKLKGLIAGSVSGGGNMGGTLQTRISGNDLVILMERANKNRNGYF
jgi:hypothetical protein